MKLFADDSSLFIKVKDIQEAHLILSKDLKTIENWAKTWKMKFNPDLTKQAVEVVFSSKYKKPSHPPLEFGNIPVAQVDNTKHLGLTVDEKLIFKEHILASVDKAKKGLSLMKLLSKYVNRKTLILTYFMHVRPHLEYGDVIFHDCAKYLMDTLESIQYQAGLICTGCWKNTSQKKLYQELGWESLDVRRHNRRIILYHKIKSGYTPDYLANYLLESHPPENSTRRYLNSFFPYCHSFWEFLDPAVKELQPPQFKHHIKKLSHAVSTSTSKTHMASNCLHA